MTSIHPCTQYQWRQLPCKNCVALGAVFMFNVMLKDTERIPPLIIQGFRIIPYQIVETLIPSLLPS